MTAFVEGTPTTYYSRIGLYFPGLTICVVVALASELLAERYQISSSLFALLIGLSLSFLNDDGRCASGIQFGSKRILQVGIILLGARITLMQVWQLGFENLLLVMVSMILTIGFGLILAKRMGLPLTFGLITSGAVSICGASAALAIASTMPKSQELERNTVITVICITVLSTISMIIYPEITVNLGFGDVQRGVFLGGSIHDIAQVIGASYNVSQQVGDVAIITKLFRVALLVPIVMVLAITFRGRMTLNSSAPKSHAVQLPGFMVLFAVMVILNSMGWLPVNLQSNAESLSSLCIAVAMAAMGMKTRWQLLLSVGMKVFLLMLAETLFLATVLLVGLSYGW